MFYFNRIANLWGTNFNRTQLASRLQTRKIFHLALRDYIARRNPRSGDRELRLTFPRGSL